MGELSGLTFSCWTYSTYEHLRVQMISYKILGFYIILYFVGVHHPCAGDSSTDYEYRLREELFTKRKINNLTRPTQHVNDSTDVQMDFVIFHIQELNERTEILSMNAWLGHRWEDLKMAWKPEDYGGIKYLGVNKGQVWVPDIYLLNSAQASNANPAAEVPVVLIHDGTVWWWPPATFKSICPIDLKAFPFDEHICNLLFVSWTYGGRQVNLTLMYEKTKLTQWLFDEHNEWEEVSSHGNNTSEAYGDDYIYQEVNFYIHLRRRAPYYRLAIIVPTVVAILMTLVTFWIPPSSRDRLLVSGFNLLVLTILIVHLYWMVPRSGSNVPGIVVCCGNAMFFAGLTFLLSAGTGSLYNRAPDSPPPVWLKNLLNGWLGLILCLTTPTARRMSSGNAQLLSEEEGQEESSSTTDGGEKSIVVQWQVVATAIDRLGFIIYCVALCAILGSAFG